MPSTYYVSKAGSDGGTGTFGSPFLTVNHGVVVAQAGDSVLVLPGNYVEDIKSLRSNVTLDGLDRTAIIRQMRFEHPYVSCTNLKITGNTVTYSQLAWFRRGAHFCQLTNCFLDAALALRVRGVNWESGIIKPFDTNVASDCVVTGNEITGLYGATGISVMGERNLIALNALRDSCEPDWFRLWGRANIIRGNTGRNSYLADGVILLASGNHPDAFQTFGNEGDGSINHIIEQNLFDGLPSQTFDLDGNAMADADMGGWTIRNNIFLNAADKGTMGIADLKVYNNVFFRCNPINKGHALNFGIRDYTADKVYTGIAGTSYGRNGKVKGNVFLECGDVTNRTKGWYAFNALLTGIEADYNYVASPGYAPKTVNTLHQNVGDAGGWNAFKWWEDHGINGGDPKFADLSAKDFRLLAGSSLINAGVALPGLDTDFLGNARTGTPDIGPYEYNGAATVSANLSALTISSGTLSPVFSSGTTSYTASVASGVSSVTVTPTKQAGGASITVNGITVASGSASGAISLVIGSNTITIVVTGDTVKTYTVIVNRAGASNVNLSALSLSVGTLVPVFAATTITYAASVPNANASLTVTPTLADATGSVKINGVSVVSGNASGAIALSVGPNTITVVVTAQDASTKTYTVTVTRAANSIATLSNIIPSVGVLSPTFLATTLAYNLSVANPVSSITVRAFASISTETIKINGITVASGVAPGAISLVVGTNVITIVATAQDGVTKVTYTLTVSRAGATNADLLSLVPSAGNLSPSFSASILAYTQSVANAATTYRVTPTVADALASVTVNGTAVASGVSSGVIHLLVGTNAIAIIVTAADGTTTKTYTIIVTRGPAVSNNARLSALALSAGTLSPTFNQNSPNYSVNVAHGTTTLSVIPVSAQSLATIKVNNLPVVSGVSSVALPLTVGATVITVMVTAQDGVTTRTYRLTVNRAGSTNANLASIGMSAGTLSPTFTSGTVSYAASVANGISSITVTPTLADASASVTVNTVPVASGDESGPISLSVGTNTITLLVTAQDGLTSVAYTVIVTRAAALSGNADLESLELSAGTLSPVFAASQLTYSAEVVYETAALSIIPTLSDAASTMTVNGTMVASGDEVVIVLVVGANTVTITTLAEDLTVKSYTLTITRDAAITTEPTVETVAAVFLRLAPPSKTYQVLTR